MKTILNFKTLMTVVVVFVLTTLSTSCSSDSSSSSNQNTIDAVVNKVNSGTWRVTYYFDNNQVETSNYAGYNFTFANNSVLTATNGVNNYTGVWSVTDSNSNDDSIDDLDFNISFASPDLMAELSDDWDIISFSNSEIKLIDVSGGNGGIDYLTFTKN